MGTSHEHGAGVDGADGSADGHDHGTTPTASPDGHTHGGTDPTTPTGSGHDHDPDTPPATGGGHDHDPDTPPTTGGGGHGGHDPDPDPDPTGPIVSLDDPRLTPQQRAAASALLNSTRSAMAAFPDEAAVTAAGYRWVGDSAGGFRHYVKWEYIDDGRELDPSAIESIVLQEGGGLSVVSALYILSPGKTMADVPDIAGSLTQWHDHQNLCWDETGTRIVGVLQNGVCTAGVFRPTPPMMHVWLEDTPCGPFATVENHGGGCTVHH
jgi:hypothetical protein